MSLTGVLRSSCLVCVKVGVMKVSGGFIYLDVGVMKVLCCAVRAVPAAPWAART